MPTKLIHPFFKKALSVLAVLVFLSAPLSMASLANGSPVYQSFIKPYQNFVSFVDSKVFSVYRTGKENKKKSNLNVSGNQSDFRLGLVNRLYHMQDRQLPADLVIEKKPILLLPDEDYAQPEVWATDDSLSLLWGQRGFVNHISAGLFLSETDTGIKSPNFLQYKNWLQSKNVKLDEHIWQQPYRNKDFTNNISSNFRINSKLDLQMDHFWSRTAIMPDRLNAIYDYFGTSNWLNYRVNHYVTVGVGYGIDFNNYDEENYNQRGISHAPAVNIELALLKHVRGFEHTKLDIFAETRHDRYFDSYSTDTETYEYKAGSRYDTVGFKIRQNIAGFQVEPGISFIREMADLGQGDASQRVSHQLSISRKQKIGKVIARPYAKWRVDSSSLFGSENKRVERSTVGTDFSFGKDLQLNYYYFLHHGEALPGDSTPERRKMNLEMKYALLGDLHNSLLLQLGYDDPLTAAYAEKNSEANANAALFFEF